MSELFLLNHWVVDDIILIERMNKKLENSFLNQSWNKFYKMRISIDKNLEKFGSKLGIMKFLTNKAAAGKF